MNLSKQLFRSVLISSLFPVFAGAATPSLFGVSAEPYGGDEPQAVEVSMGEPVRARGSLIGATFEWARNQGAPIPGMSDGDRWAACGLIAAEALARFNANNPNLDRIVEIRNTAAWNGRWDANNGMHGPDAERALLADLGMQVSGPVWVGDIGQGDQMIRDSLSRGKPVIISTLRHYFFAEGYNNGVIFVGNTGAIMGNYGGSAYMTLSQISWAGNGSLALLFP